MVGPNVNSNGITKKLREWGKWWYTRCRTQCLGQCLMFSTFSLLCWFTLFWFPCLPLVLAKFYGVWAFSYTSLTVGYSNCLHFTRMWSPTKKETKCMPHQAAVCHAGTHQANLSLKGGMQWVQRIVFCLLVNHLPHHKSMGRDLFKTKGSNTCLTMDACPLPEAVWREYDVKYLMTNA